MEKHEIKKLKYYIILIQMSRRSRSIFKQRLPIVKTRSKSRRTRSRRSITRKNRLHHLPFWAPAKYTWPWAFGGNWVVRGENGRNKIIQPLSERVRRGANLYEPVQPYQPSKFALAITNPNFPGTKKKKEKTYMTKVLEGAGFK